MQFFTRQIIILLAIVLIVLVSGTVGFMWLEGLSLLDAFYFTIITVATVGFGDIHPVTAPGKILAIIITLAGVGTFATLVFNVIRILSERKQEQIRHEHLNILVGLFFSEIGTELLYICASSDRMLSKFRENTGEQGTPEQNLIILQQQIKAHQYELDEKDINLEAIKSLLAEKGNVLLRLLENPNLLEREAFTELLRAAFHLREELIARATLIDIPSADRQHLTGDVRRVYRLAASQWLEYAQYLRLNYPYLFSFILRTNPFSADRSAIVK